MKRHLLFVVAVASAMLIAGPAAAARPPDTWDGLVKVNSKRMDIAYLQPGADFRAYTKVILEPTEVAFHKDWQRSINSSTSGISGRISDGDVQEAISKGVAASADIFADAWTKGGYVIVNAPGPDVLRVKTGIVNIWVSAPAVSAASRSRARAPEAGRATFFVEARDSVTGALLGRAVDQRIAGDNTGGLRTAASNRADFRELVKSWAANSVRNLNELKRLSPIAP